MSPCFRTTHSSGVVHNMKKANFTILILLILSFFSCTEDLTCKDFKEGTFYINRATSKADVYIVVRKGNSQIEYRDKIVEENGLASKIEWIDECSYRLFFDEEKSELTDSQKSLNENNGLVIEMTRFSGKCVYYKATLTKLNGESISRNMSMCAE